MYWANYKPGEIGNYWYTTVRNRDRIEIDIPAIVCSKLRPTMGRRRGRRGTGKYFVWSAPSVIPCERGRTSDNKWWRCTTFGHIFCLCMLRFLMCFFLFCTKFVQTFNVQTGEPLIAATFTAKVRWSSLEGGRYSEVYYKYGKAFGTEG